MLCTRFISNYIKATEGLRGGRIQRTISIFTVLLLLISGSALSFAAEGTVSAAGTNQSVRTALPLPRWWPCYRRPKTVLTAVRPRSQEEYLTLMTLSGLVARAA